MRAMKFPLYSLFQPMRKMPVQAGFSGHTALTGMNVRFGKLQEQQLQLPLIFHRLG